MSSTLSSSLSSTLSSALKSVRRPSRSVRSTRLLLGGAALALVAVPFTLVLVLVEDKWEPLAEADQVARDGLHGFAVGHPAFVALMRVISDSGSALAWQIILGLVITIVAFFGGAFAVLASDFVQMFLVMSITTNKYWRVTLDGKPVTPLVTNIAYQGVAVPAGRHRIEMRYRNTLAVRGMVVSVIATVLLAIAALLPRRRLALP